MMRGIRLSANHAAPHGTGTAFGRNALSFETASRAERGDLVHSNGSITRQIPNWGLPMTFVEMLRTVLADRESTLASAAQSLGISPQYLHDLNEGRRLPSVEVVEKICAWMGRGPQGRLEWHLAGAEAHGWNVRIRDDSTGEME